MSFEYVQPHSQTHEVHLSKFTFRLGTEAGKITSRVTRIMQRGSTNMQDQ